MYFLTLLLWLAPGYSSIPVPTSQALFTSFEECVVFGDKAALEVEAQLKAREMRIYRVFPICLQGRKL